MAKASRMRGVRSKATVSENARQVVTARLVDLIQYAESVSDASMDVELHDLRIAAKRLRYSLEIFGFCFPEVKPLLREVTALQEDIGEIHDLDVLVDLLRARLLRIDRALEEQAVEVMDLPLSPGEKSQALRRVVASHARDRRRLGLLGLVGDKVAERRRKFARLDERWGGETLSALSTRIEIAIGLLDAHPTDASSTGSRA